jgi:hypothetical protein
MISGGVAVGKLVREKRRLPACFSLEVSSKEKVVKELGQAGF